MYFTHPSNFNRPGNDCLCDYQPFSPYLFYILKTFFVDGTPQSLCSDIISISQPTPPLRPLLMRGTLLTRLSFNPSGRYSSFSCQKNYIHKYR